MDKKRGLQTFLNTLYFICCSLFFQEYSNIVSVSSEMSMRLNGGYIKWGISTGSIIIFRLLSFVLFSSLSQALCRKTWLLGTALQQLSMSHSLVGDALFTMSPITDSRPAPTTAVVLFMMTFIFEVYYLFAPLTSSRLSSYAARTILHVHTSWASRGGGEKRSPLCVPGLGVSRVIQLLLSLLPAHTWLTLGVWVSYWEVLPLF